MRCWVGGAWRERVGLLGVKGLVYWAGETWKTVALLAGLLGGREVDS